jgi:hypothetical protein
MKNQSLRYRLPVMLSWTILFLALFLGAAPLYPPVSPDVVADTDFSVARALDHIEAIAREPRPMGSLGNQRGRDEITAQLRALGLEPEFQAFHAANYYSPMGESVELVNILARIPGTASTAAIALMGHHDTVPHTLGANDDASAVAILLEAARAILAGPALRNDVILLFTDGEEPAPRFGSSAFAGAHPWFDGIGFVINLETIGSGGPSIVVEMNGSREWIIDQYARVVPYPVAFSFVTETAELIGGSNTDFSTFRDAGVAGIGFAYMTGSSIYHTMEDSLERVSARSLYQQGANTLALSRHLGNLDFNLDKQASKSVFFTIGRFLVIRYPASWAVPIVLLAGAILIAAAWRYRSWRQVIRGLVITLATGLLSAAVASGIWTLLGDWRSTMRISESYLYLVGLALLTAGIGVAMARLLKRRIGAGADALGVVILWWSLGLLTAITVPGMSYLFAWPALAGGVALLLPLNKASAKWGGLACWAVVSAAILIPLVPAIDFFYQFVQPRPGNPDSQVLVLIAIPILLVSLVIELLRVFRVRFTHEADPSA